MMIKHCGRFQCFSVGPGGAALLGPCRNPLSRRQRFSRRDRGRNQLHFQEIQGERRWLQSRHREHKVGRSFDIGRPVLGRYAAILHRRNHPGRGNIHRQLRERVDHGKQEFSALRSVRFVHGIQKVGLPAIGKCSCTHTRRTMR